MEDYIDILLSALEEEMYSHLGEGYFLASQREDQAADALRATLSADQNDLFDAYESARNDTAGAYQDAYARRAFLLARAVYR